MSKRGEQQWMWWAFGGLALVALLRKPKPKASAKALPESTTGAQVIDLERATEERASR